MKQSWIKGLDKQQQSDLRADFLACSITRKRLAEMLEEKASASNKNARSALSYDNPNWCYLQADQRGYERALLEISELLLND